MARIELNDDAIDQVVGGVFQFYKNGTRCKVQGGKYQCEASAQFQIITLANQNPTLSEAELLELALSQGILKPL